MNTSRTSADNIRVAETIYRDSSKYPLRRDAIHPGSTFRIVQERSRGMFKETDSRIYMAARDGFYAEEVATGNGCVLMPNDMVMPVVSVNKKNKR